MEIKKKYLSKYLHDIAIEQIAEDYIQKGYSVTKEEALGGKYYADIVARKNQEQIVIEVKTGKLNAEKKEKIANLADYVRSLGGYKFVIAIATPPKEKKLEIAELEQLITNYFHQDLPSELDSLSTHTRPDEVSDIDIDEINISSKSIFIKGNGVVSVEMQFGSDSDQNNDDGFKINDNFPFDFALTLGYNDENKLEIVDVQKVEIDTSSYYENAI